MKVTKHFTLTKYTLTVNPIIANVHLVGTVYIEELNICIILHCKNRRSPRFQEQCFGSAKICIADQDPDQSTSKPYFLKATLRSYILKTFFRDGTRLFSGIPGNQKSPGIQEKVKQLLNSKLS